MNVRQWLQASEMSNTDMSKISKSQKRAMDLLGLAPVDGYDAAATALEAAGCYRDGVPAGQTWRTAAKLSDADLLGGSLMAHYGWHLVADGGNDHD